MKKILFLILLLLCSNVVIGDQYLNITEFSVWNNSDASSWKQAFEYDQYSDYDTTFTADLPQRTNGSIDYNDGDYYWLHVQCTADFLYDIPFNVEVRFIIEWSLDNVNFYYIGLRYFDISYDEMPGSKTVGLKIRFPRDVYDNSSIYFYFRVDDNFSPFVDSENLGPIYLQPLPDTPTPTQTPTITNTPLPGTPTQTYTPTFTPVNTPSQYDLSVSLINYPPHDEYYVAGDDIYINGQFRNNGTLDFNYIPQICIDDAGHGNVRNKTFDTAFVSVGNYNTHADYLSTAGLPLGQYFLRAYGTCTSGYEANILNNTSLKTIYLITPTPSNTPTVTPTPTPTNTPTPFCWIEYCPSEGVIKRIPLVEDAWKVSGQEYAASVNVNGITVSAPVISGASSSAALEIFLDALHYFKEW